MSTSAWIMLFVGIILLYGGLIASLWWAARRANQQKPPELEREAFGENQYEQKGRESNE